MSEEEQKIQKMLRLAGMLELTASCAFPPHAKEPEAIVSNLKWFQLNITLHLKGKPAKIVRNTTMLPLRVRLVTENGVPVMPPDGEAGDSIRFQGSNGTVHVINGTTSVPIGIHKSITSDGIQKQRVRIQVSTIPHKTVRELFLAAHTPPFKVMVKVDRPEKRKAAALTEAVSPLSAFASFAVESEENCQLRRRIDEHACTIEELKEGQRAIWAELAELGAAIRGDNS